MKRGFTLVELIGVVVILGLIAAIVYPIIDRSFNSTAGKISDQQISALEDIARIWVARNPNLLSETTYYLKIDQLKTSGLIENSAVLDINTMDDIKGCIRISYNDAYNQYEYKYDVYNEVESCH